MKYTIITTILAAFLLSPASFAKEGSDPEKAEKFGEHYRETRKD